MASPPQLDQPPFHLQQEPSQKKHTARTVLLVVGSVLVVLIGIAIASGGGDTTKPGADHQNPVAAPVVPRAGAPKPVAPVTCAVQEGRSAPCVVTLGSAFVLGKHQVLAGWTIVDSGFGLTISGQAKNIGESASNLFITVKFLRGDEVLASVVCNTGELNAGQIETMNCLADGTYTTLFDKVTAETAF